MDKGTKGVIQVLAMVVVSTFLFAAAVSALKIIYYKEPINMGYGEVADGLCLAALFLFKVLLIVLLFYAARFSIAGNKSYCGKPLLVESIIITTLLSIAVSFWFSKEGNDIAFGVETFLVFLFTAIAGLTWEYRLQKKGKGFSF